MACFIPVPTAFSTTPSYQSPPFVSGFNQVVTGDTTFTISPGFARALCDDSIIQYPSFVPNQPGLITVDISTVGINGCYPASLSSFTFTSDTVFPVYICQSLTGDSSPVVAVVATGDNFLPPGYTLYRRIAWVFVNAVSKNIMPWTQSGGGNDRMYNLDIGLPCISLGNDVTFTGVDLTTTGIVPPNKNVEVMLNLALTVTIANQSMYLQNYNAVVGGGVPALAVICPAIGTVGSSGKIIASPDASGNAAIKYRVTNAASTANVAVTGFLDSLDNSLI